ncbi:MAG: hypothetical protein IT313_12690 [Anaerolineales bacterium]|nr:hypothetical protein [Anaerolineales bacterium]
MNKLKWWLRIVGGWYLLLGLAGLLIPLFNPEMYAGGLPSAQAGDELAVAASMDMNFVVMLVFIVLGALMEVASRDPARARFFIGAMVCLEFFAYAVVNVIWAFRGWEGTLPILILHLLFGATGFVFLRQAKSE